MNFSWPRIIDEIIAGIPDNSRLRMEVAQLREHIAKIEKENQEMREHIQNFIPRVQMLNTTTAHILRFTFRVDREVTAEEMAREFKIEKPVANYHFDELIRSGLLKRIRPEIHSPHGNRPAAFIITQDGRKHAVEQLES